MTDPWMDGARPQAPRAQRARMAFVLVIALALPALIIVGGTRKPAETTVDVAAAPAMLVASSEATTALASSSEATEAAPTSTIDETTTAAPSTAAAPSTTAARSTSSTARASSTTTTAAPTTTKYVAPVAAQVVAPTTTTIYVAPVTAAPTTAKPATPVGTQSEAAFLACVRQRESGGNYGAVSSGGTYMGAYQFAQSTWDGAARMAGRSDLVGLRPNTAAPSDQDLLAVTLYRSSGAAPWGGHCP